jgi:hypothetical protein
MGKFRGSIQVLRGVSPDNLPTNGVSGQEIDHRKLRQKEFLVLRRAAEKSHCKRQQNAKSVHCCSGRFP